MYYEIEALERYSEQRDALVRRTFHRPVISIPRKIDAVVSAAVSAEGGSAATAATQDTATATAGSLSRHAYRDLHCNTDLFRYCGLPVPRFVLPDQFQA